MTPETSPEATALPLSALAQATGDLRPMLPLTAIIAEENPLSAMGAEDFRRLRENIAAHGIEDPLVLGPADAEGQRLLVDGFHRLKVAQELGITHVPYIEMPRGAHPSDYALRRQLARRNLSRSGQALMVFNVLREGFIREKGYWDSERLRINETARDYDIPKPYLSNMVKAWDRLVGRTVAEPTQQWAVFEHMLLDNGASPSRALAGVAGQIATAHAERLATDDTRLALASFTSTLGAWEHYGAIKWDELGVTERLRESTRAFTAKLPQLLRHALIEGLTDWPENDLAAVRRALAQRKAAK